MSKPPFRPQLSKLFFAVYFKPELKFYDCMYSVGSQIKSFPHWETDRLSILFTDPQARCSCRISHNLCLYEQDVHNIHLAESRIHEILTALFDNADPDPIVRLHCRNFYLQPVSETDFGLLALLLQNKMLNTSIELEEALPGNYADLRFQQVTIDGKIRYDIVVAPVWKEQAQNVIPVNRQAHISQRDAENDYIEFTRQRYPDCAVYTDINAFREDTNPYLPNDIPYNVLSPIAQEECLSFFKECQKQFEKTTTELSRYLFASR